MASLNLSSDGPSISKSYQAVVNAPPPSGPAVDSSTYGQWAVFSVSTPLVNVFQQSSGNKESVLKVQSTGDGELADLIDEFSEGKVQFAYVKVRDPNTGLPKNVLIAWCGEGVPERTKGYFTSHLATVSKFLHGYHVQVTARSDGDLTPEGIIQKVADSSGSKYSSGLEQHSTAAAPSPPTSSKPVFTPTRTTGGVKPPAPIPNMTKPMAFKQDDVDDNGWGPDAPPITRTGLEKVQPAYKPTKVDLRELRSAKQPVTETKFDRANENRDDIVKGGYRPIGKVDIAAIRRQALEAGELKDERPEPVKGAYQPVGKVDIAAIRSRAQTPDDAAPSGAKQPQVADRPPTVSERSALFSTSERLTSLPKPKVSNKFAGSMPFTGTKPPLPGESAPKPAAATVRIGGASRTFADEGGKTPAQLWAERKAKEWGPGGSPTLSTTSVSEPPIPSQLSGNGEWKSSYTGKHWEPVQTTHTGKSFSSNASQKLEDVSTGEKLDEESLPHQSVSALREQFAHGTAKEPSKLGKIINAPSTGHSIPIPGLPSGPTEPEYESDSKQVVPSPPEQPRSPTPPTPHVRETSPIRVAVPVSRGVADAHDEQYSPPAALPVQGLQQAIPDENVLEDAPHDIGRATAEATVGAGQRVGQGGAIRAVVQYDYERAEDNEIELREGEYVTEIEMVDRDWWLGVNTNGERGLFPSNYVEVIENDQPEQPTSTAVAHEPEPASPVPVAEQSEISAPGTAPKSGAPTATALYDYEAAEDNEISFPEGAKITNIEFPDDDWWLGEYGGQTGLFPSNYVQLDE
ncbi:hypothetical protein MPDQ_005654 [Monascus purpureus]|uniref:Actin binding protein n=1 Tax=Monascus purpureus TaxID=5098 RepID=A0A507QKI0_MONPU|nr:hypothetical protein MPDQ_005654 [Monascus purpureus]BDD59123.1 hypothetical protein MAP00_004360 [Monascus purpureus]